MKLVIMNLFWFLAFMIFIYRNNIPFDLLNFLLYIAFSFGLIFVGVFSR